MLIVENTTMVVKDRTNSIELLLFHVHLHPYTFLLINVQLTLILLCDRVYPRPTGELKYNLLYALSTLKRIFLLNSYI
jgi:hypothetical protein